MAALRGDAAPISNATQPAQRRPARHPRAARTLSTAAASPGRDQPRGRRRVPAAARTRPHRVRSRTAAVSRITGDQMPAGPEPGGRCCLLAIGAGRW